MAISTTINRQTVFGDRRVVFGTSVFSGTSSSEDVVTGLNMVEFFSTNINDATPRYSAAVETFPLASGAVTVKNSANDMTVQWMAIGS